ncbi:MAG: VOC family protein [Mycolicibacterium sp.]|nr:VOC family protein [Mycolicibacterium sp.]
MKVAGPVSVAPGTIGNVSALDYLVIYVSDLEASAQFYGALGLTLVREQHGSGPVHYSAQLGETVLELYPAQGQPPTRTRLGLRISGAEKSGTYSDPDGNVVELLA